MIFSKKQIGQTARLERIKDKLNHICEEFDLGNLKIENNNSK
jgi:hypothetical protein